MPRTKNPSKTSTDPKKVKKKELLDNSFATLKEETGERSSHKQILSVMRRLSLEDKATHQEREDYYKKEILPRKKEIDNCARKVQEGTHEFLNTATTTNFGMRTALGLNPMERTAKPKKKGEEPVTIDHLIEAQRIPTEEYLCKPVPVKDLPKNKHAHFKGDKTQHVFHGHIGSGKHETAQGEKYLVLREGAGRSGFHEEQKKAQRDSTHHLSLSRRLSKITDNHQARGKDILDAYEKSGFHPKSSWGGKKVTSPKEALEVSLKAEHNFKKRQTKEKGIRSRYKETASISTSYEEIDSESETGTEDYEDFKEKKVTQEPFKSFQKNNRLGSRK